ncbi:MAG: NAD-dependent epimerase/dehydratase family protein [Fimbriimonadaceae bacterium]
MLRRQGRGSRPLTVAVLGANGFVGTRMAELWHRGPHTVRPIVRRYAALARLSRFDLDCRVVDDTDAAGLAGALAGCDAVVNCVTGDAETIREAAALNYEAANRAGARRFVYLSSASVHGQNPETGTDEAAPTIARQWHWYNNAKVQAEAGLRRSRKGGETEAVVLRPGIVWGPRSRWVAGFLEELMAGTAWVADGGRGILNSVFVDNLIHAIDLCLSAAGADGEAFFVQDDEAVCWRDLYEPICRAAGYDWADVADVTRDSAVPREQASPLGRVKALRVTRAVAPHVSARAKRTAKAALGAWHEPASENPYALPVARGPVLSEEFLRLYACDWRLPDDKARRVLGYRAAVSFADGLVETMRWLKWAGYPVEATGLGTG